ncbi:hypothetical protein DSECCO2_236880 [anaerobic digester metagenome]
MFCQSLYPRLLIAAILNTIIKAGKHTGGIGHGFLFAHLRAGGAKIGHARALIIGCHFKRTAGTRGILFKKDDNISVLQKLRLAPDLFGLLELGRQIQQIREVFRREVYFFQKIPVIQPVAHDAFPPFADSVNPCDYAAG